MHKNSLNRSIGLELKATNVLRYDAGNDRDSHEKPITGSVLYAPSDGFSLNQSSLDRILGTKGTFQVRFNLKENNLVCLIVLNSSIRLNIHFYTIFGVLNICKMAFLHPLKLKKQLPFQPRNEKR